MEEELEQQIEATPEMEQAVEPIESTEGEVSAEMPQEEGANGEPNAREEYFARMRELYPEDKFENEMDFYKRGLGYTTELENKLRSYDAKNQELIDLLDDEPLLGVVLAEFKEGKSLPYIIGKYMDKEDVFSDKYDDEDYERGAQERADRIANRKKKEAETQENYKKTGLNFDSFKKEHNMSDEEMDEFQDKMVRILESARDGLISDEFLTMMFKGLAYDVDTKTAAEQGRIDGRNEKIEAERRTFEADGLPDVSSSVGRSGNNADNAIARLKANMERNDVWSQGGYTSPHDRRK